MKQRMLSPATYRPEEASLVMTPQDLVKLDQLLQQAGELPEEIATKRFVVSPVRPR